MKIHIGDKVKICKGKDRGKEGEVLRVIQESGKMVIAGVNIRTIHKKPQTGEEKGSIEKKEMPVNSSNVMLIDPSTKKQTRVGYDGDGKNKKRVARKSGAALKNTSKKKKKTDKEEKTQPQTQP